MVIIECVPTFNQYEQASPGRDYETEVSFISLTSCQYLKEMKS